MTELELFAKNVDEKILFKRMDGIAFGLYDMCGRTEVAASVSDFAEMKCWDGVHTIGQIIYNSAIKELYAESKEVSKANGVAEQLMNVGHG